MMLSMTVRLGNSSMFWKVRAMPMEAMASGRSPRMERPRYSIRPVCGW